MSENGYLGDEEAGPAHVGIGEVEGGPDTGRRTGRWIEHWERAVGCLLVFVFASLGCLLVVAPEPGVGSGESSPALQNDRIFCWGRSFEIGIGAVSGETYPEHLSRILGREVGKSDMNWYWRRSDRSLEDVSYFDEHKYGLVIMRTNFDGPNMLWNDTEANLRNIVRRLKDTGAVVVMFETGPLWDLDGEMTTTDDKCLTGTSHELQHDWIVCTNIDGEGRTEKYYEWWGDTVFCKMAEEEGAYFIPEYVLDCLEGGPETCPFHTRLHPDLECEDGGHPNGMGYGVLAERMADYLVGWGLAEYAVDFDELSKDCAEGLAEAEEMIGSLEEMGHPMPADLEKEYRMAGYVYGKGFPYTANRTLVGSVLPRVSSVYENWDEVQDMFAEAWACVETLKEQGRTRDETMCRAFYSQAEEKWADYWYDGTCSTLDRIIAKCPEPLILSLLGLVSFLIVCRRRR